MSNPAPTLNQINAFNATIGTTIDFNIIGGTEVIRSNRIYIYDLSDNSLICTHLYVSTESIHELPPNIDSSIVYESGKSSSDFTNNTQYYAQIQTFTDVGGTQGASGLSIAKLFWCLPTPTLTLATIPTTISTTSYNVSATYTPNTSGGATNEIQEFQFNLYSAIGALLQTSGVVLYGEGVDLSYNFSGLEVDSTYYVTLDVTTTQGMNVSAQSNTFTVSIDTPTMGSASVVNNACDGYISVTSNLSSEYEHEESAEVGEIMSFTTDSVNDITELDVDFSPVQDGTPWMSAQDTEPYMFRAVPTQTEDFGHESDTIVGGTVAWNQLLDIETMGAFIASTKSYDSSTGVVTVTPTNYGSNSIGFYTTVAQLRTKTNHVYFTSVDVNPDYSGLFRFGVEGSAKSERLNAGSYQTLATIAKRNGEYAVTLYLASQDWTTGVYKYKNGIVIDLTTMFGSTIADYIYSLEQAIAGAGVAWFRKLFPKPYYAYNAGELMSVQASSHDTVGFNAWDEEWELGSISNTTGNNASNAQAIRSKNYIPVIGGATYYFRCDASMNTYNVQSRFYDADKNYLGTGGTWYCNTAFTIPTNARYMRFGMQNQYGTTYKNDICINLSWDGERDGEYEEYVKHSYALDSDLTLRGIPKLDASNNLYYDGDEYASDGTVARKYGIVDLSSKTWAYQSSWDSWYTDYISDMRGTDTGVETPKFICDKYDTIATNYGFTPQDFNGITSTTRGGSGCRILVRNGSTTTEPSGHLVYELDTPTTETADPYTNPQIVDPSGTEEYVGSPIPVGHETTYQRICPITGWTGCEVSQAGVNLCYKVLPNPLSLVNVNYAKVITGAGTTAVFKAVKGQTYRVSGATGRNRSLIAYFDSDPVIDSVSNSAYQSSTQDYSDGYVFTAQQTAYCACYLANSVLADVNIQIERGSSATDYKPYNGTTYPSTFPKYKQQVSQDKIPYIIKNIGDTYADTLTENLVGGTIAWNQSVPDTTTTHTVSGNIASMDDAVAGNFESVICDIDPLQDLHGYDSPWVGGAGKNKLGMTLTRIKALNTSALGWTWADNVATKSGVSFTVLTDANDYVVSVTENGTNNTSSDVYFTLYEDMASTGAFNDMLLNGCPSGGSSTTYSLALTNVTTRAVFDYGNGVTIDNDTSGKVRVQIAAQKNATINNAVFKPMIRASGTSATFEPYENLCPITGWTGCEVDVAGKNLFDSGVMSDAGTGAKYVTINLKPNTEYTMSSDDPCKNGGAITDLFFCNMDETVNSTTNGVKLGKSVTRTTDANGQLRVGYRVYEGWITPTQLMAYKTQIESGSVATDYETYTPITTYPVSWQTEAGTVYGGKLDVVSGVLTVDKAYVDLGTLTWIYEPSTPRFYSTGLNTVIKKPSSGIVAANIICSQYKTTSVEGNGETIFGGEGDALIAVSIGGAVSVRDTRYTSSADFKSAMNGVQLVYELATPTTYQLDPVQVACLLGQNNVWNNISDTTVTYPTNHSYQSLSTTHKYYKRINGVESISVGSDVVANVGTDNIIDLTQMFGTTIADYIYNIEQSSSSGMGVKFFKSLFPNDDYDYNSGTLISVNASAHVIKDANGNVLHTYPLDSDLVLRGIPKLDANNNLYYDGDVYASSGNVTRKYGIVDLGTLTWSFNSTNNIFSSRISNMASVVEPPYSNRADGAICGKYAPDTQYAINDNMNDKCWLRSSNYINIKDTNYSDATTFKNSLSGVYFVYPLATQTTESADPFEENQSIVSNGIEEYTVTEQGDVEMPVGHDSTYYTTNVYGGTIDMAKGVLTVDRAIVDLGSRTWAKESDGVFYSDITSLLPKRQANTALVSNVTCSAYVAKSVNNVQMSKSGVGYYTYSGNGHTYLYIGDSRYSTGADLKQALNGVQLVYELATPIEISLTPQQMQTLSGQNNIWSNTNGGMYLVYQLPITSLLVKRRDVADVSGKWLTLYSVPITQASDMDFTFIDFLNQYGKTYQYALVPVLAQNQSGVIVQIEGGYTVSDNVDSIFDGVYIADQTNVERVKAGVGYGNIDMNQGVGSITPIGSKYPIVITNSQNQYHNGSIRGTIVPNDFYSNGNLSRIDMVNKRDELEQFLTNKRAKIIKDWNGKMWLVMIMSNVACSFDDNYGMGMVSFSADWLEVGDPTNQQDLYNAGLINVGGV